MMIELNITDEQIERANKRYEFGELNGSITKGKSNLYGALGEIMIKDFYEYNGLKVIDEPTYDYDLIIDSRKVDVKTKKVTTKPEEHYINSISNFNIRQKCEFYFFVRINLNERLAYLLGYIGKEDYFKKAYFCKKGELDKTCHFKWEFKDDCWSLAISELYEFKVHEKVK